MKGRKKLIILLGLLVILLIGAVLVVSLFRKDASYRKAEGLLQAGDSEGAYEAFLDLGAYKDSEEIVAGLLQKDPVLPFQTAHKGDIVTLGSYEQDDDPQNGKEAIEWIVLERIENDMLLLSLTCLDCGVYNDAAFQPVTWEDSQIRHWLNKDFYSSAFSDREKGFVKLKSNQNLNQSLVNTKGGNSTQDHVFLLSEKESSVYIGNEMDQEYVGKASATEYAVAKGIHTDEGGYAEWWLRSPGSYEYTAQFVEAGGSPYVAGAYVDVIYGIRPAVWIDLKGDIEK
ncbi:MAG: DUF6273 domain-containing protein [Lachnospiraceae bacterium]|nr:DUF6273 domain-containing protein [Lachnospiraceae bacterium]